MLTRRVDRLTDEQLRILQQQSRPVTRRRRGCECAWCVSGPRRPNQMLLNAPLTLWRIRWRARR
jgi:hypothetical protein